LVSETTLEHKEGVLQQGGAGLQATGETAWGRNQ